MSAFVFDDNTVSLIRYLLAIQRFKDYSVGPKGLDEYLCALSFKRVLTQTGLKFPKFQKEKFAELQLSEIVSYLKQKKLLDSAVINKLNEYVDFHDSLMAQTAVTQIGAESKAQDILRFLCSEAGINYDEELNNRTFEEIATRRTLQFYGNQKQSIVESDFRNLDKLYEKCQFIQSEIQNRLTTPFIGAPISGFTPNTGGIWLPFVICETHNKRRQNERASVGVAFTPIEIRIGLNFGSQAHNCRMRYYELLLNGELMGELESLNHKATGYCLCDTFWNYHIENIQSLQWCLILYGSTKLALQRAIEETKQMEGTPLTANKYLISKVIKREDFTYITKDLVGEIAKDLDELYPIIARIE